MFRGALNTVRILLPAFALAWGSLVHAANAKYDFASVEQFESWDKTKQREYVQGIRVAYHELQAGVSEGFPVALYPLLKSPMIAREPIFSLFPFAFADGTPGYCMLGSKMFHTVQLENGNWACPADGNGCPGAKDAGFQCGIVDANACIDLEPREKISARCRAAGDAKEFPVEKYKSMRPQIQSVLERCRSTELDERFRKRCDSYAERVTALDKKYEVASTPAPAAATAVDEGDPAEKFAEANEPPPPKPKIGAQTAPPAAAPAEEPEATPEIANVPIPKFADRSGRKSGGEPKPINKESTAKPERRKNADCAKRNAVLGSSLTCIACALEEAYPGEIPNQGGVSNWVALLGVMANRNYGPYNTADDESRGAYQQQVAEMIASYGYCTNDTYGITPPAELSAWVDGRKMSGADKLKMATSFGLLNTRTDWLTRQFDKKFPLKYADSIFYDGVWDESSVQNRQWRFRTQSSRYARSYEEKAFSRCAKAANRTIVNKKAFNMCSKKSQVKPDMDANNELYQAMATKCGFSESRRQRRYVKNPCERSCIIEGPVETYPNVMGTCGQRVAKGAGEGSKGSPGNPGTPGNPGRGPGENKGGESRGSPRGGGRDKPGRGETYGNPRSNGETPSGPTGGGNTSAGGGKANGGESSGTR